MKIDAISSNTPSNYQYSKIKQKLYLDDNHIVKEFEYIDKSNKSDPIYKYEVINAVDNESRVL